LPLENDCPRIADKLRNDPVPGMDGNGISHPFWMRGAFHAAGARPGILYDVLDRHLARRFIVFRLDFYVALAASIPFLWIIKRGNAAGAGSAAWIEGAAIASLALSLALAYLIAFHRVRKARAQGFFFHFLLTPCPIQSAMRDIGCHAMRVCLPGFAVALALTLLIRGPAFLIILPALFAPVLLFQCGLRGARSALRTIALGNLLKQRLVVLLTFLGLPASAILGGLFSYAIYTAKAYWPLLLILLIISCLAVVAMMYKAQAIREQLDREFEEQMTTLAAFQPGSR
jgi:hypothetical protein